MIDFLPVKNEKNGEWALKRSPFWVKIIDDLTQHTN